MQTTETLFERDLAKLINDRINHLKDEVAGGLVQNHEDYKSKCGMIDGLKASLEMMAVAHDSAQQRNR